MTNLEIALTALRRIHSLEPKNVPKYAQAIAGEALHRIDRYPMISRVDRKPKIAREALDDDHG